MERIAVFVDDAGHALGLLRPLLAGDAGNPSPPVHWVVVGCAPRLTRHAGRWVSKSARQQWRERWARSLRAALEPGLAAAGATSIEWLVARGPLDALCERLRRRLGTGLRLLDLRRPKLGHDLEPLTGEDPRRPRWATPVAVSSSLSLVLALTD
jgi:hypothetical protein